jgi:hypothetical protein
MELRVPQVFRSAVFDGHIGRRDGICDGKMSGQTTMRMPRKSIASNDAYDFDYVSLAKRDSIFSTAGFCES